MNCLRFATFFSFALLLTGAAHAGIFSGPNDTANPIDPAIRSDDSRFVAWANRIDRTQTRFSPRGSTTIDPSGGFNSLGDLTESEIASGILPGYLTVGFDVRIGNGPEHDFAVFENGFAFGGNHLFGELAYVEVSSNGTDFARFPSTSTNTESDLITTFGRSFAGLDTTNVHNLAGKHQSGFGTPFDLEDLQSHQLVTQGTVNLDAIKSVRLVDIPGNGDFLDSLGNPILDPWLTSSSGGFDFRLGEGIGVGVINTAAVPEPGSVAIALIGIVGCCLGRRRRRH